MEDFRSRRLSLHQIIAPDASPAELVRTAGALGCSYVCLFTQSPGPNTPFPVVQDHEVDELRRLLDGMGISILGSTSFPLSPEVNVESYAAGLARTARLGGTIANVRILDEDQARSVDNLGRLGELARVHGIDLTIEFTGLGARHVLDHTLEVIRQAGCGKVTIDALHVVRTGTPIAALLRLDPAMIGYVQICDGVLAATKEHYAREGAFDRLPPSMGEFPLIDLLDATPLGMPLSLEVPQEELRLGGLGVLDRARRAVNGARRLLDDASRRAEGLS